MPSQTISSTGAGVVLTPADYSNPVTVASGVVVSSPGIAIDAPTVWSIYNYGTTDGGTDGIRLQQGGSVTNGASGATSTALISGAAYGVYIKSGGGTVTNYGTVIETGGHPSITGSYSGVLINGAGSVANSGIIRADAANSFDRAVRLNAGGTVSNAASGTIAGDSMGVYITGAPGSVSNAGSISGLNANGGTGVFLAAGGSVDNAATTAVIRGAMGGVNIGFASGSVGNLGSIIGLGPLDGGASNSMGVELKQGGTVVNGQSGAGAGFIYGYSSGIYIYGPTSSGTSLGAGTVTNFGSVVGHSLFGIDLRDGGSVTNGASGDSSAYVYGGAYGVVTDFTNAPATNVLGTVVNFGTIIGAASNGYGVALRSGGTVTNAAGATISGGYGIGASGPNGVGLTVVNAGTIIGTGANHFAVFFQTANDVLVDTPGAVFDGTVVAAGTATLELAAAATIGTISAIGTAFTGFDHLTVDDGARWNVAGSNTVVSGTPIGLGNKADLEVTGTLVGTAPITLTGGTIGFASQVDAGDTFDFADSGGVHPSALKLGSTSGLQFGNAITSFGGGDAITVSDVTFAAGSSVNLSGGTLTVDLVGGGTFTFDDFAFESGSVDPIQVTDHSIIDLACFVAGTMIRTERGEVPVETLQPGDRVMTHGGALRPVRWIGYRRLDLTRHPEPRRVQPIRIRRDAFAEGMPARDLLVSPDHALFFGGNLVPARLLSNGASIVQELDCRAVHYFHVELDSHDILLADGMPAEAYLDTGNRGMFENADAPLMLHPDRMQDDPQQRRVVGSCAAFVNDAARVEPLWRMLAERARVLGHVVTEPVVTNDPALQLLAGGKAVSAIGIHNGRYVFVIPSHVSEVRLRSRTAAPCDTAPWIDDRRALGVMVRRITLGCGAERQDVALDHPALHAGWWPVERGDGQLWRWSAGDARVALPHGVMLLEVEIGDTMRYPVRQDAPLAVQRAA